ncbi:MAG: hypothetical protein ACR2QZ_11590 [Woeseiaceae bacterium]
MGISYELAYSNSRIEVTTTGIFDFLDALEMWKEIVALCEAHSCFKILGLSMLSEPVPKPDAYDHLNLLLSAGISEKHQVAWVAGRSLLVENLRLTETVLNNRSALNFRLFESAAQAKEWLRPGAKDTR